MVPPPLPTATVTDWQIGVCCQADDSVEHCLESLERVGWHNAIRLFLEPGAVVPKRFAHLPVTCLASEMGWAARELLIVSEMLMRAPGAGALLLIQGDVVFGRPEFRRDLEAALQTGPSSGIFFLECREGPGTGAWSRLSEPPHRAPKAVVLTPEAAREYLADRLTFESAVQGDSAGAPGDGLQTWAFHRNAPVHAPDRDYVWPRQDRPGSATEKKDARIRVRGTDLSIVVPCWNCGPFLGPCLQSLLHQTVDAEIIVVDDASDDETPEILSGFAGRVQCHRHPQRRGANAARNTGLRAATGDFLVMADADNEYGPHWLERLLEAMLSGSDVGVAYCGFSRLNEDGQKRRFASNDWDPARLWYDNYIDMPSLVRREALPENGLVEGFRPFDDWRLWLDMASRGWTGKLVREDLYLKRVRKDGKTLQSKSFPAQRAREVAQLRRQFAHLVGLEAPLAVVIPAHGCEDLTVRCLAHVADFSGVPFVFYYVDNGSPVSVLDSVARAAERLLAPLHILRNSQNLGFTQAVNRGIEASGDANVLVLNNDCFVGPNCIENLAYEMATCDRVAAIGPLTCDRGGQSLQIRRHRLEAGVSVNILDNGSDPVATAVRLRQRHKTAPREPLAFFCTLLNREAIRRFGGLDNRFSSGLAADDEWCHRVCRHGWHTLLSYGSYAAHLHKSTFERLDLDRDALQQESKQLLEEVLEEEPKSEP